MAEKRAVIVVAGTAHYLDLVKKIGSQAVKISVKLEEIHPLDDVNHQCLLLPDEPLAQHGDIIFYKREGKYLVILGRESLKALQTQGIFNINGRLMSGPMLKRTRVDQVDGNAVFTPAPEVRNIPRIIDKRPVATLEQVETKQALPADGYRIVTNMKDVKNGEIARYNGKLVERNEEGRLFDHQPVRTKTFQSSPSHIERSQMTINQMASTVEPGQDRPMSQFPAVDRIQEEQAGKLHRGPGVTVQGAVRRMNHTQQLRAPSRFAKQ